MPAKKLPVVWWNVQRLFRPSGSSVARALDATERQGWTKTAYEAKVRAVAAVLRQITKNSAPGILALCEVENAAVLRDVLKATGWSLEIADDASGRLVGDDLVVAYDRRQVKLDGTPESFVVHNRFATRDLFRVPFRTEGGKPLVLITNHWPSRMLSNAEPLRIVLADACRRMVDSVLKFPKEELILADGRVKMPPAASLRERLNTAVVVLGDFNDDPFNISLAGVLLATHNRDRVSAAAAIPAGRGDAALRTYVNGTLPLYNPCWGALTAPEGPKGTLFWNNDWYLFDQVLFSSSLLDNTEKTAYAEGSFRIHAPETVEGPRGEVIAFCTRKGVPKAFDPKSKRGVSDHLPITFEIDIG